MYVPTLSKSRQQEIREMYEHNTGKSWENFVKEEKEKSSFVDERWLYYQMEQKGQFIINDH